MSNATSTHWCYSCDETVALQRPSLTCRGCGGGFLQELDDYATSTIESRRLRPRPRFVEAVSNFLTRRMSVASNVRGGASGQGSPNENSWNSFLLFSGDMPVRMPGNGGDYFIGPGVEELIQRVTINDQHLPPPPASSSSIDDLPTVKIDKKHVRAESTCAVCKERFELGSQVKKLPCKHIYHSDCIAPWLEQRSSCPVCRKLLTSRKMGDGSNVENSSGHFNRRRRWSFLWPFGSSRANGSRSERVESSPVAYHQDGFRDGTSYWPFDS